MPMLSTGMLAIRMQRIDGLDRRADHDRIEAVHLVERLLPVAHRLALARILDVPQCIDRRPR